MVDFIHNNKDLYGVNADLRILPIAASTYYRTLDLARQSRTSSERDLHDEHHANKLNESGKKVQVDMVYVKFGKIET